MRREELDTELGADPHEVIIGGSILSLHDTGGGNVLGPAAPGAGAHCSLVEAAAASSAAAGPGAAAAAAGFFPFARFGGI